MLLLCAPPPRHHLDPVPTLSRYMRRRRHAPLDFLTDNRIPSGGWEEQPALRASNNRDTQVHFQTIRVRCIAGRHQTKIGEERRLLRRLFGLANG